MSIESAAARLSAELFGVPTSFLRLGSVKIVEGVLHVYTRVPPANWPNGYTQYQGFSVVWHYNGKNETPAPH
jgi:hypothetical protein